MKVKSCVLGLVMLFSIASFAGNAVTVDRGNNKAAVTENVAKTKMTKEQRHARVAELKTRIKEIRAIDRSQLSKAERKELREEMRDIRKEARQNGYTEVTFIIVGSCVCTALFFMVAFV